VIYQHISDQHEDTLRFVKDCEDWFGKKIEIQQSLLKSVDRACRQAKFVNSPYGAACSRLLKRSLRLEWEALNVGQHTYVWGFDIDEKDRAERLKKSAINHTHIFPLIYNNISKAEAHGITKKAGIQRPAMYNLGYPNNNCIGCVKGGMGYWNKIRIDFPDVFKSRAKLERDIKGRILKECYLDELNEQRGRNKPVIVPSCNSYCEASFL